MTFEMKIFIAMLIANLIIIAIYLIWNVIRKKEQKFSYIVKAIVMFLCPVAGAVFLFLGFILFKLFFSQAMDLEDVVFSKDRVKTYIPADEERERNMVSLEEALVVTDKTNLRTLMMNVVRGDYRNSLFAISSALNSEDSETAHYAASVLQDVLNDFRANVQKKYQDIQKNDQDQAGYIVDLITYMNQVLEQHVFTELEQTSMIKMLDEICEILYQKEKEKMISPYFEIVSLRLLEIKDYDNCKKWCDRAAESYPGVLATYTCQLKLYFSNGDKDKFFDIMEELKASNVIIDNETLEMIRIFRE